MVFLFHLISIYMAVIHCWWYIFLYLTCVKYLFSFSYVGVVGIKYSFKFVIYNISFLFWIFFICKWLMIDTFIYSLLGFEIIVNFDGGVCIELSWVFRGKFWFFGFRWVFYHWSVFDWNLSRFSIDLYNDFR